MKKIITIVLIFTLLFNLSGCYTPQLATKQELLLPEENNSLIIETNDSTTYAFEKNSYTVQNDSIIGKGALILENGAKVDRNSLRKISLEDVQTIKIGKIDVAKTTFVVAAGVGLSVLIALGIRSLVKDMAQGVAEGVGRALNDYFR